MLSSILEEIQSEYERASKLYPPFHSTHEGYAVIVEELDELWELVKQNKETMGNKEMTDECIQIAAMAVRFIADLGRKENCDKIQG